MFDPRFLDLAIRQGQRQMGRTGTRPAVGCAIVKDGIVVGLGATGDNGAPHAEVAALAKAGENAQGADAYVSLEPCAHFGKTPPCADALTNAGIRRVFSPFTDPDPRVQGLGFERMRAAGIEVTIIDRIAPPDGLAAFFTAQRLGRPMVTIKMATTIDGKVALADGSSKWITGDTTRRATRAVRARYGAIGVGVGTILADDPQLNARTIGIDRDPRIVIFDRQLRTPVDARVFEGNQPIIFCDPKADQTKLADKAKIVAVDSLKTALGYIAKHVTSSILIEGGPRLIASFVREHLADRILLAQAPKLIGASGRTAVDMLDYSSIDALPRGAPISSWQIGDDRITEFKLNR